MQATYKQLDRMRKAFTALRTKCGGEGSGRPGPCPSSFLDAEAKWMDSLTPEEFEGVREWERENTICTIMRQLQTGKQFTRESGYVDRAKKALPHFESAIDKAPHYEGVIYRGLHDVPPGTFKPGGEVDFNSHSSATRKFDIAMTYAQDGEGEHPPTVFKLNAKTGARLEKIAADEKEDAEIPNQQEVLVRKGTKYRIKSVQETEMPGRKKPFKVTIIELDEAA